MLFARFHRAGSILSECLFCVLVEARLANGGTIIPHARQSVDESLESVEIVPGRDRSHLDDSMKQSAAVHI